MKLSDGKVELARRHNKVDYRDGDRVVKVFNDQKPAADVFNEAHNLALVEQTGIRVPEVLEVSRVESGSWALATSFVPGTTLHELAAVNPEKFPEYIECLIDTQISIQRVTSPLLNRQKDKLSRMVGAVSIIDATTRYDLQTRIDGMKLGTKVCHGDFVPSNVIVGDDGNVYLCDWAHVTAGLPEVDAAQTYLLLSLRHPEWAKDYLDLYVEKTGISKQDILYWQPVVAAAELARGRERDEAYLMNLVGVGDFE